VVYAVHHPVFIEHLAHNPSVKFSNLYALKNKIIKK